MVKTLPRRVTPEKHDPCIHAEATNHEVGYGSIEQQQPPLLPLSDTPVPLSKLLNARRVLCIANYGVLSLFEVAFYSLQPLFYSTAIEYGGLGFSPMRIGLLMACFGIFSGLVQAIFFASLVGRLGPKTLFRLGHMCLIPLFIFFPIIHWIAQQWGINWLVWVTLVFQFALAIVMDMAFGTSLVNIDRMDIDLLP